MPLLDEELPSFRLAGEDLTLVTGVELERAVEEYKRALERIPRADRGRFREAQSQFVVEAHRFVTRYNQSLYRRVRGYLELGRRCDFVYQWPVVAALGICQVLAGFTQARLYGLAGQAFGRLGMKLLDRISDTTTDILRRTNRGIFHDSVPTVLYALFAHRLRREGDDRLARQLLEGPLPLLFDEESRAIAKGLFDNLGPSASASRFEAMFELTKLHFRREQSIFSHHLGTQPPGDSEPYFLRRFARISELPAPTIQRGKVVFKPYKLPAGFDMRDHDARVREFTQAFIEQSVSNLEDYKVAAGYVVERFGESGEIVTIAY